MKIIACAILSLSLSAQAKEITVSGDSSERKTTESLLQSADKITIKDENGQIVAYKLGKIEKNSTLAKLGLKSGDILNMPRGSKKMIAVSKVRSSVPEASENDSKDKN